MPTVLRAGPYRFFFYSSDGDEPLHVHVERDSSAAKFWLSPVRLESNHGFRTADLARIGGLIRENERMIVEQWHEYFGT
jgi:hypothetical protein